MQQIQTGRPAYHAACALARSGVVRGEHIGDAVGDGGDGEQSAAAGHAHQRDQTAVEEDREHEDRDHKAAPRALGEREDAAHAHHAGAADGEYLDPHFAAVIRQSRDHRREQHEQAAHDIRAARERVDARAHVLLGLGDPGGRDRRGNDELVNAMQGDAERHGDERTVEDREVAVILDEPRDKEEPEQVLDDGAVACQRDRRVGGDRAHQEEADGDEQDEVGVYGRGAQLERRALHRGVPQQIAGRREHEHFIPAGGDERGQITRIRSQTDKIVERQVHRQTDEQQAAHAGEAERPADEAVLGHAHNGAPDGQTETVDEAVLHGGADAYDQTAQRRSDACVAAVRRRAGRSGAEALPQAAEPRVGIGLADAREKVRDRAFVIPGAQAEYRPYQKTVFKNRFHRLIPRYRPSRCCRSSRSRWSLR